MSITCPGCGGQTRVIQTDASPKGRVSRVRHCGPCAWSFATHETIAGKPESVVVTPGPNANAASGVHPAIRFVVERLVATGTSMRVLGSAVGVHPNSISRWTHGATSPSVYDVEAALNVLGYELTVKEKP